LRRSAKGKIHASKENGGGNMGFRKQKSLGSEGKRGMNAPTTKNVELKIVWMTVPHPNIGKKNPGERGGARHTPGVEEKPEGRDLKACVRAAATSLKCGKTAARKGDDGKKRVIDRRK